MLTSFALGALALLIGAALALAVGAWRWQRDTAALRERLLADAEPRPVSRFDARELDGLPEPVARWFRQAMHDGQPIVAAVRVRHEGTFDMGRDRPDWKPFSSDQFVVTRRRGFDWDARIRLAPGLAVHVRDAYISGRGVLHASIAGLASVMRLEGAGAIAEGELMRFMAEATWYPTALLPSQGVRWEAIDTHHARATLVDGPVTLSLTYGFGDDGFVDTVRAEARGRAIDGRIVPTPWLGRFRDWQPRNGLVIPLEGEVAWALPAGERPYWRGRIVAIEHDFADSDGAAR
jgi:hypothetical protein